MPFTYSIAYGLIAGICSYIVLNTGVFLIEKISGERIKPKDKELKEFWTYKLPGGVFPPWLKRAAKGKKDFWKEDDGESGIVPGRTIDGAELGREKERVQSEVGEVGNGRSSGSGSGSEGDEINAQKV